jgi:hypothetical protein
MTTRVAIVATVVKEKGIRTSKRPVFHRNSYIKIENIKDRAFFDSALFG